MKKKPVENKKEEKQKPTFSMVDPIDRIPMINYNEKEIVQIVNTEKTQIDNFRSEWFQRKLKFLSQWDNYLSYPSQEILKGQKNYHIPITHEKLQAWHARMYKSIFAFDEIFSLTPLNLSTRDEVQATREVMKWYLNNEINYGNGLKPFVDELLWDLGTDGWAIAYKHWETLERVMVDLEEIQPDLAREEILRGLGELKSKGKITSQYKEVERIVKIFSGVVVETVPQECVYFPDYIPTSGDLNHPELVMVERMYTEDQLKSYAETGYFDKDAVEKILKTGKGQLDPIKQEIQRERERLQGVEESQFRKEGYPLYTAFLRKDLKEIKFPQEYVFTLSLKAQTVARGTYLDRVCRDGNRPVYKFDLLKRPRSSYSRGFVELLYPLNQEVDEFHNFRRASGKIANMPWGFYRASSGLEKEILEVHPGKFFPVDDPQTDVRPMIFGNVTTWALQEEQLAQSYADRLTSMPPMMQGQVPNAVGPLRSTSGVMALMNEAQTPLDVYLDRLRGPLARLGSGILSDIQFRMPDMVKLLVLGDHGDLLYGKNGEVLTQNIPKSKIMGKYKFTLAAVDAQYNPERDRQNAMAMLQLGMSQFPVQMGIVTPENAYNLMKDVFDANGRRDIGKYLTAPQASPRPLSLFHEYTMCIQGMMPAIVLNDDHQGKIQGLSQLMQNAEYLQAKNNGIISPLSDVLLAQSIQTHAKFLEVIQSLEQAQNQSGSNLPPTVGARSTGQVNAQGEQAPGGQSERQRSIPGAGG